MTESRAVVDNWTLELAAGMLEGVFSQEDSDLLYKERLQNAYDTVYVHEQSPNDVWIGRGRGFVIRTSGKERSGKINGVRYTKVQALLQFLDLVVMYDTLVVDSEMVFAWERFVSMQAISSIISKVRLGEDTREKIKSAFSNVPTEGSPSIISAGALYYLGLANMLGLDYWASPKRAEFLSEKLRGGFKKGFVTVLDKFSDEKLHTLAQELIENDYLGDILPSIYFPGFGAAVLLKCKSRTEILEKALDFRQLRECVAFRRWLVEMDEATREGNLRFIAKNMGDLQGIIADIRKDLAGGEAFHGNVELEIGLSPSLTFNSESINAIRDRFKPRKLHLSFLRHHFYSALENSNIWYQIWRLFPELQV
jgi:hypothetical protein